MSFGGGEERGGLLFFTRRGGDIVELFPVGGDGGLMGFAGRAEGIVIKPIKCAEFKDVVVSADANLLSGLLLDFDAAIPEMRQVAERLLIHYRKEELEHEINVFF